MYPPCDMKGIILAGGAGTRLYPLTRCISKQLLPVYDKPTIYYPLSRADARRAFGEILIISHAARSADDRSAAGRWLADRPEVHYKVQPEPKGIAQAFTIGADFVGNNPVCLILGDNIFYGHELTDMLDESAKLTNGALRLRLSGERPRALRRRRVRQQTSKPSASKKNPKQPKSNCAVVGLYYLRRIGRRDRAEPETLAPAANWKSPTSIARISPRASSPFSPWAEASRGWIPARTIRCLSSSQFVQTLEERQGLKVACIEEIAFAKGFIDAAQLKKLADVSGQMRIRRVSCSAC